MSAFTIASKIVTILLFRSLFIQAFGDYLPVRCIAIGVALSLHMLATRWWSEFHVSVNVRGGQAKPKRQRNRVTSAKIARRHQRTAAAKAIATMPKTLNELENTIPMNTIAEEPQANEPVQTEADADAEAEAKAATEAEADAQVEAQVMAITEAEAKAEAAAQAEAKAATRAEAVALVKSVADNLSETVAEAEALAEAIGAALSEEEAEMAAARERAFEFSN